MLALPPPLEAPAPSPLLDRFITERLVAASDPELRETLQRLWAGSLSFRAVLEALYREQPKALLQLRKIDSESFGDILLTQDPKAYPLVLSVQWRGVQRGLDLPEPWLAGLLFALLEISRVDGVIPTGGNAYQFGPQVRRRMWNFQAQVRKELRAHDAKRYQALAPSGEHLYWNVFPPRPRLNRD